MKGLRKYPLVRKQHPSKKALKKQKGNVNGRKVKRWQEWNPKDMEYFTRLSSMLRNNRIFKKFAIIETKEKLQEDVREFCESVTESFTGKWKSAIEVNMVDLLQKCKKQGRGSNKKKRWRNEPIKDRKIKEGIEKDQITLFPEEENCDSNKFQEENVNNVTDINDNFVKTQKEAASADEQNDDDDKRSMRCRFLLSEISEFMVKSFVQRSVYTFPPAMFIHLRKNLVKEGKQFTSDTYLQPGLVVQELLSSALSDPSRLIGEYK